MAMKFKVSGMTCAACSARVEKAVKSVVGVEECQVNLLTASMTVDGNVEQGEIIRAVEGAGYGACPFEALSEKDEDTRQVRTAGAKRLVPSVVLLIALMYISMGRNMLSLPLPGFIADSPFICALIQLMLCLAVSVINRRFFINGAKGVLHGAPNMDTLVALGSFSSFAYSVYLTVRIFAFEFNGNTPSAFSLLHGLYFEAAAMILTLITVGKMLEERAKGKTTDAIRRLVALKPKTATVRRDGKEITVLADEISVGDVFIIRPGQSFPADGIVVVGESAVDEAALTGESIPVDKRIGDKVSAATVNTLGYVECKATAVGEDTALSQIVKMVSDAASNKAPISKIADRVSGVFVPTVLGIAVITFVIWLILGQTLGFAVARAVSVLVVSCPCSLGLATPVAIMVASGVGAKNNVLFKTATALENTGKSKTVIVDKTGTLTMGRPTVTDVIPLGSYTEKDVLSLAATLEEKSEHPLARAVFDHALKNGASLSKCEDFEAVAGRGVTAIAELGGETSRGYAGNLDYIRGVFDLHEEAVHNAEGFSIQGKTPLVFAFAGELVGIIAVADEVRPDSKKAVAEMKSLGCDVVMLTGDNSRTALAVARSLGIERVVSDVLPEGKMNAVNELSKEGETLMIGDGINDAPALKAANVGMAIGTGTDVAIDSADVVLMKNSLLDAVCAIKLSRKTLKNIKENLFWAFFYNMLGIPIAAGALSFMGVTLSPLICAAAMSLSSICVVSNALRLNFITFERENNSDAEEKEMFFNKKDKDLIELDIEGMMCPHCENRVKKALQETEGVAEAEVSFKKGNAKVKLNGDVDRSVLIKVVEDAGYTVK